MSGAERASPNLGRVSCEQGTARWGRQAARQTAGQLEAQPEPGRHVQRCSVGDGRREEGQGHGASRQLHVITHMSNLGCDGRRAGRRCCQTRVNSKGARRREQGPAPLGKPRKLPATPGEQACGLPASPLAGCNARPSRSPLPFSHALRKPILRRGGRASSATGSTAYEGNVGRGMLVERGWECRRHAWACSVRAAQLSGGGGHEGGSGSPGARKGLTLHCSVASLSAVFLGWPPANGPCTALPTPPHLQPPCCAPIEQRRAPPLGRDEPSRVLRGGRVQDAYCQGVRKKAGRGGGAEDAADGSVCCKPGDWSRAPRH